VIEQIRLDWQPLGYFGAAPTPCFSKDGRTLYVCNGTQNAVGGGGVQPAAVEARGLIPVGWYPGAIALDDARHQLAVANIKGIGSAGGHA